MAQNFSLGPGGPLQPQSGIVTNRFAPTTTGSQQLQDILRWLDAYKNKPNFTLGQSGDLLPKYSTGRNPLVPYQPGPNFKLGQGGPLRTPTSPKNIIPLLEDKLSKRTIPTNPDIDKIYSNKVGLDDIAKSLKGANIKNLAKFSLPETLGASALMAFGGVQGVKKYLKSFGEYAKESFKNTGRSLSNIDADELNRIKRDFNSLYFSNPENVGPTSKVLQAIMSLPAFGTAPGVKKLEVQPANTIGAIDFKESKPKVKTEEPKQTNIEQYQFDPVTGLPILPEEAIGWNTKGDGLTQPPSQIQAVGNPQQIQQPPQQPQPSGRTIDDIIALAQAQQQLRNEQMAPYMEALQEAMEKYGEGQNRNFFRDLGLAGMSGLTGNQAYTKMIGGYDENKPVEKRLALQQQLSGLQQQQLFDPTQIYGNVELVKRLGLAPEASLANPEVLKQYANIYNYGLDYDAVLARLKQQEEQNKLDRELKWLMHMNPQYNTLASQAQLGSSILSNMQFSPALRESMTPEMIQYLISLTGFRPNGQPVINQPQPAGVVQQPTPTRGNLNSLRNR